MKKSNNVKFDIKLNSRRGWAFIGFILVCVNIPRIVEGLEGYFLLLGLAMIFGYAFRVLVKMEDYIDEQKTKEEDTEK